jgi:lipoprotein-releasing system ATP-binding protein
MSEPDVSVPGTNAPNVGARSAGASGTSAFVGRTDAVTVPVLEARQVRKTFVGGDGVPLHVLRGVDLTVHAGEMVAVIGESGSGKSTLLHLLGALDRTSEGDILLDGQPLSGRSDAQLAAIRNKSVGLVFQFHHLLREFSALENVSFPLRIAGVPFRDADRHAQELLERVGLGGRLHHRPSELSGGEQQRTAVARALVARPAVVLADEPSGNLDHANGERLHDLLAEVVRDLAVAMVVVTHNRSLAERATVVYKLEEGELVQA